jgi:leucyl-tRNA synthetase
MQTNENAKEALAYWESVDLYIGGNEHDWTFIVLSFWNKFQTKVLHQQKNHSKN